MMRVQNQPLTEDPSLIRDIQSEVSNETRPFLQFIVQNAKYIIAVVVALILALAGTGVYRYITANQQEKLQGQLARIEQGKPDAAQLKSLEALAAGAPERFRPSVYEVMAMSALAQGDFSRASAAYGAVARQVADTPIGLAAALNEAGTLLSQGKYAEGVKLLEPLVAGLPVGSGDQARLMMAEGAVRAGQFELAARTYEALAGGTQDMQAGYYRARAKDIRALSGKVDGQKPAEGMSLAPAGK